MLKKSTRENKKRIHTSHDVQSGRQRLFSEIGASWQAKKESLRRNGQLAPSTQILVRDLEACIPKLAHDENKTAQLQDIISRARREEFHDFYASEDSDGDTKDVVELVLMLQAINHPSTNSIADQAREGKYDATNEEI